jgi:hypothetical protein
MKRYPSDIKAQNEVVLSEVYYNYKRSMLGF